MINSINKIWTEAINLADCRTLHGMRCDHWMNLQNKYKHKPDWTVTVWWGQRIFPYPSELALCYTRNALYCLKTALPSRDTWICSLPSCKSIVYVSINFTAIYVFNMIQSWKGGDKTDATSCGVRPMTKIANKVRRDLSICSGKQNNVLNICAESTNSSQQNKLYDGYQHEENHS